MRSFSCWRESLRLSFIGPAELRVCAARATRLRPSLGLRSLLRLATVLLSVAEPTRVRFPSEFHVIDAL